MCAVVWYFVCMHSRVRVCVVSISGSNNNTEAVLTESSEVASTPSSQCAVARQPRVQCSREALFVPYEWFTREWKDGRRWGWEKEIHKLVNGRAGLQRPGINGWAHNLGLAMRRPPSFSLPGLLSLTFFHTGLNLWSCSCVHVSVSSQTCGWTLIEKLNIFKISNYHLAESTFTQFIVFTLSFILHVSTLTWHLCQVKDRIHEPMNKSRQKRQNVTNV